MGLDILLERHRELIERSGRPGLAVVWYSDTLAGPSRHRCDSLVPQPRRLSMHIVGLGDKGGLADELHEIIDYLIADILRHDLLRTAEPDEP
jgi:hypothetical protein